MKKLNNKGFTLIELLAVIVILAIIMVVTIPAIMTRMDNSKKSMLQSSAETVAKWMEDQYALAGLGSDFGDVGGNTVDSNFKTMCGDYGASCKGSDINFTAEVLKAAGVKASNYDLDNSTANFSDSGRVCVKLTASSSGDFKGLNGNDAKASSTGC